MKDQVIRIVILIVSIILGLLVWQGIMSVGSSTQSPTADRASLIRVSKKACVDEATRYDAVTNAQANQYCQCVLDDVYAGKTVTQIREMDKEFVGGTIPEKYDQVIVSCARAALN